MAERLAVAQKAAGSIPVGHPTLYLEGNTAPLSRRSSRGTCLWRFPSEKPPFPFSLCGCGIGGKFGDKGGEKTALASFLPRTTSYGWPAWPTGHGSIIGIKPNGFGFHITDKIVLKGTDKESIYFGIVDGIKGIIERGREKS